MKKPSWMLPEDVVEMLPDQAERVEHIRRQVINLMHTWGYRYVTPPLIEFLDSLLSGTGHDLELQTFKLTDRYSGRIMGVRADITPQVARIDAHRLPSDEISRYCYAGSVLRSSSDGMERRRNPILVGAELFGTYASSGDMEVILIMLSVAAALGIEDTVLDIGNAGIFRALCAHHHIDGEYQETLHTMIQRKARADMDYWFEHAALPDDARQDLTFLIDCNGDLSCIDEARNYFKQRGYASESPVQQSITRLAECAQLLCIVCPKQELNVDLAEVRGYAFHNGLVFALYVVGYYEAIARGGRYDGVGAAFGKKRPATGFSADLLTLAEVASLPERHEEIFERDLPRNDEEAEALRVLRQEGKIVRLRHQTGV